MSERSVFFDEWQACLRAHYKYVICAHDPITEPTLRRVLLFTGVLEEELLDLQDEARAENDDCFDDEIAFDAEPELFEVVEVLAPEPPVLEEVIEEIIEEQIDEEPDEPENEASNDQWSAHGPQQLSLF